MGNKFMAYSLISIIVYSLAYAIFETIGPFSMDQQLSIDLQYSRGLLCWFWCRNCHAIRSSAGGDDALALLISRYTPLKIQWAYLLADLVVLVLSLTYIPFTKIIYSLITVAISGQLIGHLMKK